MGAVRGGTILLIELIAKCNATHSTDVTDSMEKLQKCTKKSLVLSCINVLHINLHFIHYVPSEFSLASKVSCLEAGEDPWLVVQPERTCLALTEHYDNEKKSLESRTPLVAGFFVVNIYYSSSGRDLQYSEGILNLY